MYAWVLVGGECIPHSSLLSRLETKQPEAALCAVFLLVSHFHQGA